jgi:uncharacterized membrane protein YphA (DoxX/SURF4 family)
MLLRIVVGYHFYKEGTNKLKNGFTSKYFLAGAKGPFAPYFRGMLDDPDGLRKLCVKESKTSDGEKRYSVDPETTFLLWNEFIDESTSRFGFGSPDLIEHLAGEREKLAEQIQTARAEKNASVDTLELERLREKYANDILKIRSQPAEAQKIYESHMEQLGYWLDENEIEIVSHFSTANRADGFDRDGVNREQVAIYVDSLRGQVDTIKGDRKKKLAGWSAEVTSMWDSLENQINALAVTDQIGERGAYKMFRHYDQETSFVKYVDMIIPWFDTIVGVLLIIGLFSRFASLAAALFLISVILTQPPWIPGTEPTYFYFIELMALLVIFALSAGRMGGLDYFFSPNSPKPVIEG